jgi:hypothetical protein
MKKVIYVGLDVHKESIVVGTAPEGDTSVELCGQIGGTLDALDKLIRKKDKPEVELHFVYEAGPCGYVIYRHLKKRKCHCEVIAPSLILVPRAPGTVSSRIFCGVARPAASGSTPGYSMLLRISRVPFLWHDIGAFALSIPWTRAALLCCAEARKAA